MVKEHINAADAYAPPWHFNQAVKVTEGTSMIFLSALAGYQPDGTLAESDVVAQAEAAFENMARCCVPRAALWPMSLRQPSTSGRTSSNTVTRFGPSGPVTSQRITQHPRSCKWSASLTPTTFSRSKQ